MAATKISLDDKYALVATRTYLSGIEALVRLPILQHQRDTAAGLNTAGFISGYRGSPLAGVDQALWKAQRHLDEHHIHFRPGLNEDIAATSVWGTQQVNLFPGARYDGVFALWYGKGPGVDRSMDVIKHGNAFGTSRHGGVLVVAGDDHACKSSSLPHQSEHMFIGASVPVLNPANVQEVLDLGIVGWALSRYSGCWVGLKAITENMDSAMVADIDPERVKIVLPEDFQLPPEGLNARWPVSPLDQERILNKYRIYAARHFARVNRINRITLDSPRARLGIITAGKSYLDVLQALESLGIDEQAAADIGLRVFKLGMSWPLEPQATHEFARGLEEILVVEEKRSVIEDQLTGQLYNWPVDERPRVVGEFDEAGRDLLPNLGELTPAQIARAIAGRIGRFYDSAALRERLAFLDAKERHLGQARPPLERKPHFCSGCPHNTSTRVPEGSRALAGIGCHYMVQWMDRNTETFTQMGGEGATWIGQAPFTETRHVFQNLGDGTYFHSGLLAIRAAVAAGVNITYKILYNNAVAMTGGQPVDGTLSVAQIVWQLRGEGLRRIAVVSDAPQQYPADFPRFEGLSVDHRDRLDLIQRELRDIPGTTAIIYDQTCAAEKRRNRKKQRPARPLERVFINSAVCEGCGDCSVQSNCLSVLPEDTELGRKRVIDQSACNQDYSCLKGFCPSFVTVTGGTLRKPPAPPVMAAAALDEPVVPALERPWNVLVTGIGGTGVLTVSAILAVAAHIEGKGCSTLNQTGMAQKFGAVVSHVRIGGRQEDIHAVRIAAGEADLLLGCDLVVSASTEALTRLNAERSRAVVNSYEAPTSAFISDPDTEFPAAALQAAITAELGGGRTCFVDATTAANRLMGDAIAGNLFLLGFAYQRGLIPVAARAIEAAIELNGVAVEFNRRAFTWGRRAVQDSTVLEPAISSPGRSIRPLTELDDIIAWRRDFLTAYQDGNYAAGYEQIVTEVRRTEQRLFPAKSSAELSLTHAVAVNYFKLLAYKDEYEVARLYSNGEFLERLHEQFEGDIRLHFHLAPPLLSRRDPVSGHLVKRSYPQWMLHLFKWLAPLKILRGTRLDIFGYSEERRLERRLSVDYRADVSRLLAELTAENHSAAVEIAKLPAGIRGYGHVKARNIELAAQRAEALWRRFRSCGVAHHISVRNLV